MPELPEIETIVRQLASVLPGRRIRTVEVHREDLLRGPASAFVPALSGAEIRSLDRRGKNIVIRLVTGSEPRILAVNLGMTGRLLIRLEPRGVPEPRHIGVTFRLDPQGVLFYSDSRRFGRLMVFTPPEWERESQRLGIEPLGPKLTRRRLHLLLSRSRAPVRSWLLDQTKVAGIGNIYAAEALYRARIHPAREARSLNAEEAAALLRGIRSVLRDAIRSRGTTFRDYRTTDGGKGGFEPSLQVYGRQGKPCPRCRSRVRRIVFANRAAFFCPSCQREESRSDT